MTMRSLLLSLLVLALAACQALAPRARTPVPLVAAGSNGTAAGRYDNHAQVWTAREAGAPIVPPRMQVSIEPLPIAGWSLWHLRLDVAPPIEATWAMQRSDTPAGVALVPHRSLETAVAGAAFDPVQWTPLEGCTLRGPPGPHLKLRVDEPACSLVAPELGTPAAVLPLALDQDGDRLRVRLYADRARGNDAHEDARRIETFRGWAAINGAGPAAPATSDWHMDRALELGSEGGTRTLHWRDGTPSGWSLLLERLTYRDGNVPVLKLSVVDDASGRTLAYAWANDDASRIGINLGWLQVGLQRSDDGAREGGPPGAPD